MKEKQSAVMLNATIRHYRGERFMTGTIVIHPKLLNGQYAGTSRIEKIVFSPNIFVYTANTIYMVLGKLRYEREAP